MPYFILLLGLLACFRATAQEVPYQFSPLPLDARTHRVTYADTVPVAATAAQLLARAQSWPGRSAYQVNRRGGNPATGSVTLHVSRRYGLETYAGELTLWVQEGRYVYQLTHLTYAQPGYARAGKHSAATITQPLESLVYSRPSRYRTRKLAEAQQRLQQLLDHLALTMRSPAPGLVSR